VAGPQGVPGVAALEVITNPFTVPPGTTDAIFIQNVSCPVGKLVLSGGFNIPSSSATRLVASRPNGTAGWQFQLRQTGTTSYAVTGYIVCARVTP
jgi:hypothetical protein